MSHSPISNEDANEEGVAAGLYEKKVDYRAARARHAAHIAEVMGEPSARPAPATRVAKAIDFNDPTTWDGELSDADALSLAMWAINTLKEPQGSTPDQYDVMDFFTDGALARLDAMREERS